MSEDEAKITSEEEEEEEDEPEVEVEVKTPKGKRGRPAKNATKTPTPKKAGKKEVDEKTEETGAKKLAEGAKRGRGRPKKVGGTKPKKPSVPGRGRGRPKKA